MAFDPIKALFSDKAGAATMGSALTSLPNWIVGWLNQQNISQATGPSRAALTDIKKPSERVGPGKGPRTMGGPFRMPSSVQDFLGQSGIAQPGQALPQVPGQEDIARSIMQGTFNRQRAQENLASDQRGALEGFAGAVDEGTQGLQAGLESVQEQRQLGLQEIGRYFQYGFGNIERAQRQTAMNLGGNLQKIDSFIAESTKLLSEGLDEVRGMREEGLGNLKDRTAEKLASVGTAFEQRLASQKAEIDGRTDIPASAREAMKQRLEFASGMQRRNMTVDVMTQEGDRYDRFLDSQNQMVTGAISQATGLMADIRARGAQAVTEAYGTATGSQAALAQMGTVMGTAMADMSRTFRAQMSTAETGVRQMLAAFQAEGNGRRPDNP
jgi:hypothetical protein